MSREPNYNDLKKSERYYSQEGLFEKIKKYACTAGKHVIYRSLLLYYALSSPKTSISYKGIIIGALGYFISPFDIVPDVIPVFGYADDLAAITLVIAALLNNEYIDEKDRDRAKKELSRYFEDCDFSDLDDF